MTRKPVDDVEDEFDDLDDLDELASDDVRGGASPTPEEIKLICRDIRRDNLAAKRAEKGRSRREDAEFTRPMREQDDDS